MPTLRFKFNIPKVSKLFSILRKISKRNIITRDDLDLGIINVEIDHTYGGMFAQLNWCLYIFAFAKINSVVPRVALVSRNYRSEPNKRDWFGDYFRYNSPLQNNQNSGRIRTKRISHFSELGFTIHPDLTLNQAHNIFFETVSVQDRIQEEVEEFVQHRFLINRMLGLHYRGTDKSEEAPRVSYERVVRCLHNLLEANNFSGVFIASDEQRFIDFLLKKVFGVPIVARVDSYRSLDGKSVYNRQRNGSGNKLGLDAIVNCMLLSRCHSALRTSSFLSAWASIFNPDLRVYLLNRPYAATEWFPEREILKNADLLSNGNY